MEPEIRICQGLELTDESRDSDGELPKITGYAAVFNKKSEDMGFREIIRPGAFERTLKDGSDVRALADHDPGRILGRNTAGTLDLETNKKGLKITIHPPNTTAGRDTVESIRRGDLDAMSFGFRTVTDAWNDDFSVRELLDVDLFDVSVVAFPAYPQTSAAIASRDRSQLVKTEESVEDQRIRLRHLTIAKPVLQSGIK